MKKSGFTLAESIVTLTIIAILTACGVHVMRTYDKDIKYMYSNIYYSLDRAWYNTSTFWIPQNADERDPFLLNDAATDFAEHEANPPARMLCRALIEYINPVDRAGSCHAIAVNASGSDASLTADNVQFVATNGVRFWISRRYPNDATQKNFFIVYADLNGTRLPNSMEYRVGTGPHRNKTLDPDIFAFAILDTGRVCPLGVPEIDTRYMGARIMFTGDDGNTHLTVQSVPYILAKANAWGYYTNPQDNNADIMDEAPLSYNDYIKEVIDNASPGSMIYSFLGNLSMVQFYRTHFNENEIFAIDEAHHCARRDVDTCDVIVDKYTY